MESKPKKVLPKTQVTVGQERIQEKKKKIEKGNQQ